MHCVVNQEKKRIKTCKELWNMFTRLSGTVHARENHDDVRLGRCDCRHEIVLRLAKRFKRPCTDCVAVPMAEYSVGAA